MSSWYRCPINGKLGSPGITDTDGSRFDKIIFHFFLETQKISRVPKMATSTRDADNEKYNWLIAAVNATSGLKLISVQFVIVVFK